MKKRFLHIFVAVTFLAMQMTALYHTYGEDHWGMIEHTQCQMCHFFYSLSSLDVAKTDILTIPDIADGYKVSVVVKNIPKCMVPYFAHAPPSA